MPDKAVAARLPHKRFALADALILAAALSSLLFIWLIAVPAFAPESMLRHAPHAPMRQVHMV